MNTTLPWKQPQREDRAEALVALEQQRQRVCARTRVVRRIEKRVQPRRERHGRARARRATSWAIRTKRVGRDRGWGTQRHATKVTLASSFQRPLGPSMQEAGLPQWSAGGPRAGPGVWTVDRLGVLGLLRRGRAVGLDGLVGPRRRGGRRFSHEPFGLLGRRVVDHVDGVEQRAVEAVAAGRSWSTSPSRVWRRRCRTRRRACRRSGRPRRWARRDVGADERPELVVAVAAERVVLTPRLAKIRSLPAPPSWVSSPGPPNIRSRPPLPTDVSLPSPPTMQVAARRRRCRLSSPGPPKMRSRLNEVARVRARRPASVSLPGPPTSRSPPGVAEQRVVARAAARSSRGRAGRRACRCPAPPWIRSLPSPP